MPIGINIGSTLKILLYTKYKMSGWENLDEDYGDILYFT